MIPKIAGKGSSFKGAGQYYLHDKGAGTADRVAFTHTENLPTDNPETALKIMAHTAMHQAQIKAANGAVKTGRKLTQAVYAYSLSWHPDERPDRQDMLEAARQTIQALGLADHEAVFVSHNDEQHPHIHVIVNRVNPQTGIAAKLSNDRLILSRWAEEYERRHGKIRCEERVQNNAERRARKARGESGFVKHRPALTAGEAHAELKARRAEAFARRQAEAKNLAATHKGQRDFLHDEKERRIAQGRAEIKEANRPEWAALFRRQKGEFRQMHAAQASFLSRLVFWLRNKDLRGRQGFIGALAAIAGGAQFVKELTARHEQERQAFSREVRAQTQQMIQEETRRYRAVLERVKTGQSQETGVLRSAHAKESMELARAIKAEADRRQQQTMGEEFRARVGQRIRKERARGGRGKGRGRERDRE